MTQLNLKYILWILIFFFTFVLFNSWENEKYLNKGLNETESNKTPEKHLDFIKKDITNNDKEITVETDLISAKISLNDGNISYLSLKKYYDTLKKESLVNILNKTEKMIHFAKFGFIDTSLNISEINYSASSDSYTMNQNESELVVVLKHKLNDKFSMDRVYVFKNYSYDIDVKIYIKNLCNDKIAGRFYGCIGKSYLDESSWFSNRAYHGAAVYTDNKIYKKLSFNDIDKATYVNTVKGGWIAFVENYFLSTWIPDNNYTYVYTAEKNDQLYVLKYINDKELILSPNECKIMAAKLFAGPKVKDYLSVLHKGLDLSIDYGFFWPVAFSVFLLLSKIFLFVNNWGLSIIIITVLIKLLFYNLSAMSYKSLKQMKNLQPKLESLKERYKDDKKELNQAVLELYKTEKVNPLSGCLPILIQIPVFISLYCVLLESVELRHSPFIFWITDLSSKDIYYILPIMMSVTMFIQQKLNPPVQDPLQRKIVSFMPFVFLFIFLQFPSGLVLYWVVNNLLSIIQQWIITKNI